MIVQCRADCIHKLQQKSCDVQTHLYKKQRKTKQAYNKSRCFITRVSQHPRRISQSTRHMQSRSYVTLHGTISQFFVFTISSLRRRNKDWTTRKTQSEQPRIWLLLLTISRTYTVTGQIGYPLYSCYKNIAYIHC